MIPDVDPMMRIDLTVGDPVDVGTVAGCARRVIPITGGTVSGGYTGKVLAGGADWQQVLSDGTIEIHARYVLQLVEGAVEVDSRGLRAGAPEILARLAQGELVDPALYYFRTAMRFKTAVPALGRLNSLIAISRGERLKGAVRLAVYEVD